ncbi:hypothetical protein [Amycolatopsis sp. NPDC004079]|uniref:hypothetical protein n=1 Tax=Amycolatopsis sp. NPDC004079 TaxID=3154549 RepID=UPI0033B16A79
MERQPRTIGVNAVRCGSIQSIADSGAEECFLLRADGQPNDTAVQLAVRQANLAQFITTIVETARREFPDAMRTVPPL